MHGETGAVLFNGADCAGRVVRAIRSVTAVRREIGAERRTKAILLSAILAAGRSVLMEFADEDAATGGAIALVDAASCRVRS